MKKTTVIVFVFYSLLLVAGLLFIKESPREASTDMDNSKTPKEVRVEKELSVIKSAGEIEDWKAQGITTSAPTSTPKVTEEQAIKIAKKYSPPKPKQVKAYFVKVTNRSEVEGDRWIVAFKGVRVSQFTSDGISYYDSYYVVIHPETGEVLYSFTRGFKTWPNQQPVQ